MWIDHLLFWAAVVGMLSLAILAFFAVRALLQDDAPAELPSDNSTSRTTNKPSPDPTSPSPP